MSARDVLKQIKSKNVEYVDLRFTDPRGKLQHLTMDKTIVDEDMLNEGSSGLGGLSMRRTRRLVGSLLRWLGVCAENISQNTRLT